MNLRKILKLIKHPIMYFIDANRNRKLKKGKIWEPAWRIGKYKSNRKYSIISAVYNVEKYIEDFIYSVEYQTCKVSELILVDDGSTDGTSLKIENLINKFNNIIYIRKENGGQSTARNKGLDIASGDYVTFIDPDDFIDSKYIENIDKCINRTNADIVNARIIIYREKDKKYTDNHFLKRMFSFGERQFNSNEIPEDVVINNVARTFYRLSVIGKNNLRFNERIREFEDGQFAVEFIEDNKCKIAICPAAKYYNRRRSDESSTMQNSWKGKAAFTDVFTYGYLFVFGKYFCKTPFPRYVQKTLFAQLVWHILRFLNNPVPLDILTKWEFEEYLKNLRVILSKIDNDIIENYEYNRLNYQTKVGILSYFKNELPSCNNAYVEKINANTGEMVVTYIETKENKRKFEVNVDGNDLDVCVKKIQLFHLFGEIIYRKIYIKFKTNKTGLCFVRVNNRRTKIRVNNKWEYERFRLEDIFDNRYSNSLSIWQRIPFFSKNYKDCWLISDRIDVADDNGEHLYRYLKNEGKIDNKYFVISKTSKDWGRLRNEGFRLIPYGSLRHCVAKYNCKYIISSQCDSRQLNIFSKRNGLSKWKFVFLQHGVTKDDISNWINKYDIDLMVTATQQEWESIVGESEYKFSKDEVKLTGFPRYDLLLKNEKVILDKTKTIVIMPTWRKYLVGGLEKQISDGRLVNDNFENSDFFKAWSDLLNDEKLVEICERNCIKIIFWPHVNMIDGIRYFNFPSCVKVLTCRTEHIQNVFKKADVFVTDYSSTAFDVALLKKPVIYYQFDKDIQFSGCHTYKLGYYSYEDDGFGPILTTKDDVIKYIEFLLQRDFLIDDKYLCRINKTFRYFDLNNCKRVVDEINKI